MHIKTLIIKNKSLYKLMLLQCESCQTNGIAEVKIIGLSIIFRKLIMYRVIVDVFLSDLAYDPAFFA